MISVLLPTYNSAKTLGVSVRSILRQTFRDLELVLLDDGSSDDTEKRIGEFRDERIRYIRLPHQGLAATLNHGLSIARYNIVARMDAGDIALPDRLERQFNFISTKSDDSIVACAYAVYAEKSIRYVIRGEADSRQVRERLSLHCDFPHSGVMYYRQFIQSCGGYAPTAVEDYELWLRIKDRAHFYLLPDVLMVTLYEKGSLSNANVKQRYAEHYKIQERYYRDLRVEFGIADDAEERIIRGWREYFYGNRGKAREYWQEIGFLILLNPRVALAWLISYLPEKAFVLFKESSIRYRLKYAVGYYSAGFRTLRRSFGRLVEGEA